MSFIPKAQQIIDELLPGNTAKVVKVNINAGDGPLSAEIMLDNGTGRVLSGKLAYDLVRGDEQLNSTRHMVINISAIVLVVAYFIMICVMI